MTLSLEYTMDVDVLLSASVTQVKQQEVVLVAMNSSHQSAVVAKLLEQASGFF